MNDHVTLKMPGKVHIGKALESVIIEAIGPSESVLILTDQGVRQSKIMNPMLEELNKNYVKWTLIDSIPPEPSYMVAQEICDAVKEQSSRVIVAVGGGSVMDIGKIASIIGFHSITVEDLLNTGYTKEKEVKLICVPTTAGTGSEATPNAIVAIPEEHIKIGIVEESMIPEVVILDGNLLKSLPYTIAAATGVDALAHAIECYTSNKANPISNVFAQEAMKIIFRSIEEACEENGDMEHKNAMLRASFYAGVAIATSGTTGVHALSYPLGGTYHIPHGVANAILLSPVMRYNEEACVDELAEIYDVLGAVSHCHRKLSKEEKANAVLERMEDIIDNLGIPKSLTHFGIESKDIDTLAKAAYEVKRLLNNNKRVLTVESIKELYKQVI